MSGYRREQSPLVKRDSIHLSVKQNDSASYGPGIKVEQAPEKLALLHLFGLKLLRRLPRLLNPEGQMNSDPYGSLSKNDVPLRKCQLNTLQDVDLSVHSISKSALE